MLGKQFLAVLLFVAYLPIPPTFACTCCGDARTFERDAGKIAQRQLKMYRGTTVEGLFYSMEGREEGAAQSIRGIIAQEENKIVFSSKEAKNVLTFTFARPEFTRTDVEALSTADRVIFYKELHLRGQVEIRGAFRQTLGAGSAAASFVMQRFSDLCDESDKGGRWFLQFSIPRGETAIKFEASGKL